MRWIETAKRGKKRGKQIHKKGNIKAKLNFISQERARFQ